MFAPIRKFISSGGDQQSFFNSSGRTFRVPFGKLQGGRAVTPNAWCHVLGADESREVIVVFVSLFAGPEHVPNAIYVTLGRLPSQLVIPNGVWGHQFVYDKYPAGKYAGEVFEVSMTRLN